MVTGRAVVLITSVEDTALVFGMVTGLVVNWQVAAAGRPDEQLRETLAL